MFQIFSEHFVQNREKIQKASLNLNMSNICEMYKLHPQSVECLSIYLNS
jgi:hypothetical protein